MIYKKKQMINHHHIKLKLMMIMMIHFNKNDKMN